MGLTMPTRSTRNAKKAPPGVRIVRKPDGREYHYAGHYGGAPRILAEPFSDDYYRELIEKRAPAAEIPQNQVRRLIANYRTDKVPSFAPNVQKDFKRYLERIDAKWGSYAIQALAAKAFKKDVRAWRDEMKATPRAADYAMYAFKAVLQIAVREGDLIANPLEAAKVPVVRLAHSRLHLFTSGARGEALTADNACR